jgi:hypothetical protein
MRTYLGLTLVAAATSLVNLSCSQVECGQGTVERDGVCYPADTATNPSSCGGDGPFETEEGLDGKCWTKVPTVCDETSTREEVDDTTGVVTCIGTAGGCGSSIDCPAPAAGKATLCGRIWDAESDDPIAAAPGATGTACGTPTTDGPCSLRVRFFDAVDFASDPMAAQPLAGEVLTDDCNRYRGKDLTRATFGFIGVGVDDAPGITPTTPHRVTGVAASNAFASPGRDFAAYTTKVTTDMAWHTSSGIGGMTFAQRGVLAVVFHYHNAPVAGVQIRRGGATIPADDFYFSDTTKARTTVAAAQTVTGANGTALALNPGSSSPTEHDGVGGLPSGCQWPTNLAAAIPGVVFVQIKDAQTAAGAACP